MSAEGLITRRSGHTAAETRQRLIAQIDAGGLTLFAQIDHAAGAAAVGQSLRPTDLLIFGNARGGTPLMSADQTVGLDLPLKALVWQDASGAVWVSYSDPLWMARRFKLPAHVMPAVEKLAAVLDDITRKAAGAS
jgi:uncharacterized protein (DUF302 family)